MSATRIPRDELARLLENEAHNAMAERIRAGSDPRTVLDTPAIRKPRYGDQMSREAIATFEAVISGELEVSP
jgi:hypothetical protein